MMKISALKNAFVDKKTLLVKFIRQQG